MNTDNIEITPQLLTAFENILKQLVNYFKILDLGDRLNTSLWLRDNNWNTDARINRNGTLSYRWQDNPHVKLIIGQDSDLLQRYRLAGDHHSAWLNEQQERWTAAMDLTRHRRQRYSEEGYETDESEIAHHRQRRHRHF